MAHGVAPVVGGDDAQDGAEDLSCAIVDALSTLPNTVGDVNQPCSRSSGR
jgi:hypothetical protein